MFLSYKNNGIIYNELNGLMILELSSLFIEFIIIIIIVLMSVFHAVIGWKVSYKRLPRISVLRYILTDFPFFQLLLITSFYVFFGCPLEKLLLTLKVLLLLDQALPSILSRWLTHCSLLSHKHCLMLFNISLAL